MIDEVFPHPDALSGILTAMFPDSFVGTGDRVPESAYRLIVCHSAGWRSVCLALQNRRTQASEVHVFGGLSINFDELSALGQNRPRIVIHRNSGDVIPMFRIGTFETRSAPSDSSLLNPHVTDSAGFQLSFDLVSTAQPEGGHGIIFYAEFLDTRLILQP
ncbi:MAG: hypothetical protein KDB03_15790 [Planctomycetales bacterium]|nr:hypothetical protein [Planctomycetales bacterium]